jgi:putative hydrolase of the HAD superfamily
MKFKGFVFDFDGLIIDTEIPRYIAWREAYENYGQPLSIRDWWIAIGTGPAVFDPVRHLYELTDQKIDMEAVSKTVDTRSYELMEKAELLPGVEGFIQSAADAGMPMAVASSSSRSWVTGHLERYGLIRYFQHVETIENVENVKPAPDLYLLAVKNLAIPIDSVLTFEDSPNGIKAAKAAGLRCIAVPNQITREMDLSQADKLIGSFSEIRPQDDFFFD